MKVAVIIRGLMRTYDVTKNSLIKNVLIPNDADLFVYTYDVSGSSSIPLSADTTVKLNEYKFSKEYGEQDKLGENVTPESLKKAYGKYLKAFWIVPNDKNLQNKIGKDIQGVQKIGFDTNRIYSAYYTTTQSVKSFDLWCKTHKKKYDAVILMRPDLQIYSQILVNKMDLNEIHIPDNGGNINMCGKTEIYEVLSYKNVERCEYIPYKTKYFTDQFMISSYENIMRLKNFYSSLLIYENRGFPTAHPESVMFYHMAYLPNIPVALEHIEYEILRNNYVPEQSLINPKGKQITVQDCMPEKKYFSLKKIYLDKNNQKIAKYSDKYGKYKNCFLYPLSLVGQWFLSPLKMVKYAIVLKKLNRNLYNIDKEYVDLTPYQLDVLFSEYEDLVELVPNFYDKIKNICKDNEYNLILTYHMGDIFFTAAHCEQFQKTHKHKLHFIVRPSQEIILKLLNITNYTVCDFDEYIDPYIAHKVQDKTTYGYVKMRICEAFFNTVPTLDAPFVVSIKNNYYLEKMLHKHHNYPVNFFHEWGLCLGFDNKGKSFDHEINIPEMSKDLKKKLEMISPLDKMVLFAPETRSDTMFDVNFWNYIASIITEAGYTIILNTTDRLFNINNAIKIDMSFSDLIALGYRCHSVFSIRSGLCDVLYKKGKNLYVFYTKERWKSRRWGEKKKNYISINTLFKLPRNNKVNEIILGKQKQKICWNGIDISSKIRRYMENMK